MSMKTLFVVLVFVGSLCYAGGLRITFHPFRITMSDWANSIGWFFLIVGIIVLLANAHHKAYKEGLQRGADLMIEQMQELVNKQPEAKK